VLRERTRAEKFVARAYVPKWAGKGDRGGIASLADRRCPDSELQVRRYVTRPGVSERDRDFAGISVYRRCWLLDVPDASKILLGPGRRPNLSLLPQKTTPAAR